MRTVQITLKEADKVAKDNNLKRGAGTYLGDKFWVRADGPYSITIITRGEIAKLAGL